MVGKLKASPPVGAGFFLLWGRRFRPGHAAKAATSSRWVRRSGLDTSVRRQAGAGARGKRAAEGQADDADAHARVRPWVGDGGGGSDDTIL